MKKDKFVKYLGTVLLAAMALTACGKSNTSSNTNATQEVDKLKTTVPAKPVKQGGTLKVALETDTPFQGIFLDEISENVVDYLASQFGDETLFYYDNHYKINDKGPATLKVNRQDKTITVTAKKGVKWSDGKQVTAKDLEYSYEIIANKKTNCDRYTDQMANIVGLKQYHDGKAKTISGITYPDGENGRSIVIHFQRMYPGMYNAGSNCYSETAAPYHYLKNVPFDKLQSSDQVRKEPLFFGPYKVQKIVRGQSVTWVPNKYYWRGKPKLDKILTSVVSTNSASEAIRSHKFDVINVINTQWNQVKKTKGYNFVAQIQLVYYYLGFKVGKWDSKQEKNVVDKNNIMNSKPLRQAMAYAMNVDQVDKRYTQGLKFRIPTLIPAGFGDYFDKNAKGYTFNLKKANEILDKAGYKKKGKWRTQPNGKPLKINFMAMSGNATQEPIIQNYLQQWHKIGLDVKLLGGRLTEQNSFYDKLNKDNPDVNAYIGGFGLSTEPSQANLYSEKSLGNYSRFATPENTRLINEMDAPASFNHKHRVEVFHKWQNYMNKEAYIVPLDSQYTITAVNNKLTNYSVDPSKCANKHPIWYDIGFAK
ncbi:oligopeptide ABC transporter substrate-binding protein [Lactobacillus sp. ESL0731]|uniref:oligopeptide ABC transporter substrate-binding protein n=1 Tax=unclassified Lactobacillus TaxID=2620435 RepID=UPI0023F9CAF9|nr:MULTISPECIES: oligopeptide ABC transporter substrate-binding protein [unclassified Lactobacillus]WEV51437.1 oligopeptide ABC transporter substrate-binding protein [Lactobacillus sp. ESL0700]WEV62566.1 oligopeptide ABC transporter substrate-binding protein [Lactobacillus sp. ESL0731]